MDWKVDGIHTILPAADKSGDRLGVNWASYDDDASMRRRGRIILGDFVPPFCVLQTSAETKQINEFAWDANKKAMPAEAEGNVAGFLFE